MGLKLTFAPLTDVGRERSENQDAYGSGALDELRFYVVCDGMGGHRGGSTASKLGVQVIEQQVEGADGPVPERLRSAFLAANQAIFEKAQAEADLNGMGTTAVVLAIEPDTGRAWVAHVGDSRIYLVRGDRVRQLTRDHTFVQRLVDEGLLTRESADSHPQSNVILRSLGGQREVEPEVSAAPLQVQEGDAFVLCSDGLHGLVAEQEIAHAVRSLSPDEAAAHLVSLANDRGGHDNITVEIVTVGELPEPAEQYVIERPPPAPGTRLALAAAQASGAADDDASPSADDSDPDIETTQPSRHLAATDDYDASAPRNAWAGPFLITAVIVAILVVGGALFGLLRSSPSSVAPRYSPDAGSFDDEPENVESSSAAEGEHGDAPLDPASDETDAPVPPTALGAMAVGDGSGVGSVDDVEAAAVEAAELEAVAAEAVGDEPSPLAQHVRDGSGAAAATGGDEGSGARE